MFVYMCQIAAEELPANFLIGGRLRPQRLLPHRGEYFIDISIQTTLANATSYVSVAMNTMLDYEKVLVCACAMSCRL